MNKMLALLLAVLMMLSLCACGAKEEAPAEAEAPAVEESATDTEDLGQDQAAMDSASNVVVAPVEEEEEGPAVNEEMFALAEDCLGRGLDELYAAIGEPDSIAYSSSCLEEEAEDGELLYEGYGFYVSTLRRADGSESIQYVGTILP